MLEDMIGFTNPVKLFLCEKKIKMTKQFFSFLSSWIIPFCAISMKILPTKMLLFNVEYCCSLILFLNLFPLIYHLLARMAE